MSNLDLNNLTSEQERVLGGAYRYIKQRAAWLRAKKKAAAEGENPETHTPATADNIGPSLVPKKINFSQSSNHNM